MAALVATCAACQPNPAADEGRRADVALATDLAAHAVTELEITDIKDGDGALAEPGKAIVVHYTGWLFDPRQPGGKGRRFDSSLDRGQPFQFELGAGRVIRGWDEGFAGMRVGGQRRLIIPPELGYGSRGAGSAIPPNATLLFEVELLDVR